MSPRLPHFLCDYEQIIERIDQIDPQSYDRQRNYLDGAVTWLSPFLAHGIISTKLVADRLLAKYPAKRCYKLLFELAWREYFHRVWQLSGDDIFGDIKPATYRAEKLMPLSVVEATTGVDVIDNAIRHLQQHGTMHNHERMWIAGTICNIARTDWKIPARWLHYHLLDGDLASNTLSWQWIAGTFSHKQYIANQDNLNKYSRTVQKNTFLDHDYQTLNSLPVPENLQQRTEVALPQTIPGQAITPLDGKISLRSVWQLGAMHNVAGKPVLFFDTAICNAFPMSDQRWKFIAHWASKIPELEIYCGTTAQLQAACRECEVTREEYPVCSEWPGVMVERDWLYPVPDSFNSFSSYWKQVKFSVGL